MKNSKLNTLGLLVVCISMILTSCKTKHAAGESAQTDTSPTVPAAASPTPPTDTNQTKPSPTAQSKTNPMLSLTAADQGKTISVQKGQKIQLTLHSPGDGGYQFNEPEINKSMLTLDSHGHNPPPKNAMMGDFGTDTWVFLASATGMADLTITASRPGATGSKSTSFSAHLQIQ